MKSGYILKGHSVKEVSEKEMSLINQYAIRKLTKDEVYIFSVVLCDNEIDRDFDRFTKASLEQLAKLFVGKTGILDHDMKAENQKARTISCRVEQVDGRITSLGEPYCRLVARVYMVRTEKNKDLILEIESGIKKEVSVNCSVCNMTCSVCGANLKTAGCRHIKGTFYQKDGENVLCYAILENPTDAYEWSFVAVPAQREAGVIKAFIGEKEGECLNIESLFKQMKDAEEIIVTKKQLRSLDNFIENLKIEAQEGKQYREELKKEVVRLAAIAQPNLNAKTMEAVASKMSLSELKEFRQSFLEKTDGFLLQKPQLIASKQEKSKHINTQFQI